MESCDAAESAFDDGRRCENIRGGDIASGPEFLFDLRGKCDSQRGKKAENDDSVVMRCYESKGCDTKVTLHSFKAAQSAMLANIIEDEIKPLPVHDGKAQVSIGRHAIETTKVRV